MFGSVHIMLLWMSNAIIYTKRNSNTDQIKISLLFVLLAVGMMCRYQSDESENDFGQLRISLIITPGTNGMTKTYPIVKNGNELPNKCGLLTAPNKGSDWVSEHIVEFDNPATTYTNSFNQMSCPLTHVRSIVFFISFAYTLVLGIHVLYVYCPYKL